MSISKRVLAAVVAGAVVLTAAVIALIAAGTSGGDDDLPRVVGTPVVTTPAGDGSDGSAAEATAGATAGATPEPSPTPDDDRLLPDLASMPPEDVHIEIVDDVRRLRFTSSIANIGVGPIETIPDDLLPCPDEQRHASQVIYHDEDGDGEFDRDTDVSTSSRPAGCMLDHPGHNHWHFDAAARYALYPVGSTDPVVTAEKVSFCWRDNREVPGAQWTAEQHYGDCSYDTVQGISPGWADVYPEHLDDQHLDLPNAMPDGTYCLQNDADPYELLDELDDSNNGALVAIVIEGTSADIVDEPACELADFDV